MKKLNRIGIKQILQKRQNQANIKSSSAKILTDDQLVPKKYIEIAPIIQKISQLKADHPIKCQIPTQDKILLIQAISQRQNVSLNLHTLVDFMTVWKVPEEMILNECSKKSLMKSDIGHSRNNRNYYVLKGTLQVYKKHKHFHPVKENLGISKRKETESSKGKEQQKLGFTTEAGMNSNIDVELLFPEHDSFSEKKQEALTILEEMSGWGTLFGRKQDSSQYILLARKGIFVEIKNPQIQSMLVNPGGMDPTKKLHIISKFPIFKQISKKIQNIIPFIQLKNYTRNEYIYHTNQKPAAVYLIIKGQIVFQVRIDITKKKHTSFNENDLNRHKPTQAYLQTQKLGVGGYFGQQEILNKIDKRNVDSICHSSDCSLLEIPVEKFEKLLAYSDFVDEMKFNADIKIKERKEKVSRGFDVKHQFSSINSDLDEKEENASGQNSRRQGNTNKPARRKRPTQPIRMHGKIIRKFPQKMQAEEDINFSMLKTNPDMYAATLKKFRKYTMKQPQKLKPQVNWKLKRIWKVLNLESVLREDAQVTSPQGKMFYQSHRRLQNHVQQVKSIRPKTSSSTYRTKLQYIAYLQQFND